MKLQRILSVVQGEISGSNALSDLEQAVGDMTSQLNQDPNIDTEFATYSPSPNVVSTKPADFSSEETYLENVLEELDGAGVILDGDLVIIADSGAFGDGIGDQFGYGYGGATWSPSGSDATYTGSRVLHTPSQIGVGDPVETFYNLAIHEVAHGLSSNGDADKDHEDGEYQITGGPDGQTVSLDVSPLATAYTYVNEVGGILGPNVDTDWQGGSDVPESFCNFDNFIGEEWCGGEADPCRHTTEMSSCIKSKIDDGTPL